MTRPHPKAAPQVAELIDALASFDLCYVVIGSVGAMSHGVEASPGDFDVTPLLDEDSRPSWAQLLIELEASPETLGHWELNEQAERRWIVEVSTPEQLAAWRPDPMEPATFDHLFMTRLGNLDIVPDLAGDYATLMARAELRDVFGRALHVAHIDEILSGMTVPRRAKDKDRVSQLRRLQRGG